MNLLMISFAWLLGTSGIAYKSNPSETESPKWSTAVNSGVGVFIGKKFDTNLPSWTMNLDAERVLLPKLSFSLRFLYHRLVYDSSALIDQSSGHTLQGHATLRLHTAREHWRLQPWVGATLGYGGMLATLRSGPSQVSMRIHGTLLGGESGLRIRLGQTNLSLEFMATGLFFLSAYECVFLGQNESSCRPGLPNEEQRVFLSGTGGLRWFF